MRKVCLFIILVLAAVTVDAQSLIGFQGYYTTAKLSTDTTKLNRMQDFVNGFGGGVSFKHFELGPIGLQAELNYEKSGFGFSNDTLGIAYHQDLTYVSVPMLIQCDIGKHVVHFVGAIGPYINILLSAPEAETNMETVMMNGFSKLYTADFNRFTFGLMGEAGIAIATKVGVFQITGRASIGMSKLAHFEGISLFNYTLPKSFGAGLNYYVPFGENAYSTKKEKIEEDTIVSELEILSDSLNAVSDTMSVDKSSKPAKKQKVKKDKKNKNKDAEPVIEQPTEPEEPVSEVIETSESADDKTEEPTESEPTESESTESEPTESEPTESEPMDNEPDNPESQNSEPQDLEPEQPDNNQDTDEDGTE